MNIPLDTSVLLAYTDVMTTTTPLCPRQWHATCSHLTQAWDDADFLRCIDCGATLGRAYSHVDFTISGQPALFVIFNAHSAGDDLAAGTIIDYRKELQ